MQELTRVEAKIVNISQWLSAYDFSGELTPDMALEINGRVVRWNGEDIARRGANVRGWLLNGFNVKLVVSGVLENGRLDDVALHSVTRKDGNLIETIIL